ncbi:hypothetical protein D1007_32699 [Hordeum vulgare]|nr:hypothetical protein D1007_32699 [Hordeum vulgare]
MSKRTGPPKHQNSYAWKPNLGRKINETVSRRPASLHCPSFFPFLWGLTAAIIAAARAGAWGRFRPLSEITGVCQQYRDQIHPPLTPYSPPGGIRPLPLCTGATGRQDPLLFGNRSTSTTVPRQCLLPRIQPFIDMDSCFSAPWCRAGRVLHGLIYSYGTDEGEPWAWLLLFWLVAEAFRTFDRDSRSTEDTSQLTSSCAPWCHYKWLEEWCMLTRWMNMQLNGGNSVTDVGDLAISRHRQTKPLRMEPRSLSCRRLLQHWPITLVQAAA